MTPNRETLLFGFGRTLTAAGIGLSVVANFGLFWWHFTGLPLSVALPVVAFMGTLGGVLAVNGLYRLVWFPGRG